MLMIALFGGQISVSIGDGKVGPLVINEPLLCQQRTWVILSGRLMDSDDYQ